eukprot:14751570-Alexandrium_andersonii.AAC.1
MGSSGTRSPDRLGSGAKPPILRGHWPQARRLPGAPRGPKHFDKLRHSITSPPLARFGLRQGSSYT